MKKFLILFLIFIAMPVFSQEIDKDLAVLESLGLLNNQNSKVRVSNPQKEIKKLFKFQEKYTNKHDIDSLKNLYADKYVSGDGFDKKVYLNLAEKTWNSYRNFRYKCYVKNIILTSDSRASVEVEEFVDALSYVGTKYLPQGYGVLKNSSKSIYFVEKINNRWQVVTDNIYFEHTNLTYGSARFLTACLMSPEQVNAGSDYDIALYVEVPKDSIAVGSIGRESITYPQKSAEEIFRKLSDSNILERIVKANSKNINEYAVSFYVIMKTNESDNIEDFKMKISGVGLMMNRVNVVPKNKFIKVEDEKNGK